MCGDGGSCEAADAVTVLTVFTVAVCPAPTVTTDDNVPPTVATTAAGDDDTTTPLVCATDTDVFSATADCAATADTVVMAAAAAVAGGCVAPARVCCATPGIAVKDVTDDVAPATGTDCTDFTAVAACVASCCLDSRSLFTCVTILVI